MGRPKNEDIRCREHIIKVRLNNKEYQSLVELTKKRGYKSKSMALREALRHDFVWFVKGYEAYD